MSEKTYTKPELRSRIKSQVMSGSDGGKPGQWSARKAQLVAQKYEDAGGGYKGPKTEGQKSLSKWTDEKWTTSDGKPAEKPDGTMRRYLPEKAWDKLSPAQKAATNKKKVEASRKGQQFVSNTNAAQEARSKVAVSPEHALRAFRNAADRGDMTPLRAYKMQGALDNLIDRVDAKYPVGTEYPDYAAKLLDTAHALREKTTTDHLPRGGDAAARSKYVRKMLEEAPELLEQVRANEAKYAPKGRPAPVVKEAPQAVKNNKLLKGLLLGGAVLGTAYGAKKLYDRYKGQEARKEAGARDPGYASSSILRESKMIAPAAEGAGGLGGFAGGAAQPSAEKTAVLAKHQNPKGGLTEAGRKHFERSGESKDLKPGVKKPESEMSVQDMKRKGSWARRFYGQNPLPPLKKPNGEPTRLALTANAWGEPVPESVGAARAIAAKGTRLLEKAKGQEKEAQVLTELKPHQQRVIERIKQQPGLVVAHGMGSGKTLSSIAAAEELGGPASVLVPAALQANYEKEIAKHVGGEPKAQFNIGSLQRAALRGEIAPAKTLIVDEAHRLRDPGSLARKAVRDAEVEKRLLLTGTPLYNRPYDLASLVNVAANQNVFPGAQSDFDKMYLGEKVTDPGWYARTFKGVKPGVTPVIKNEKQLGGLLKQWVDFHENTTEGFPDRQDEVVSATLSPKQQELYNFALGDAPAWVKYKIQHGLPPSKAESKDLNAFAGAIRQISTSPGGFAKEMTPEQAAMYSPKLQQAYQRLAKGIAENPAHRAVVYSNFLEAGLTPYESLLKQHGVPYGKFTGEIPKAERDQMVRDYNEGKLKALLLSSAGGEGLDLKGTRQIQVLEPHWNKEKLEQVIARGIRYKSHEHLPEDQRKVLVEHYMSQMPEPGALKKLVGAKRPGSIDEYLRMMSDDKDRLNQQVKELLKQPEPAKTASLLDAINRHNDAVMSL